MNVFIVAITATHTKLLSWLIQEAKYIPETSQLKIDAMHYAASDYNPEYLQMFIVQGLVNINALHSDGSTILSSFMRFLENILRKNDKASDEEKTKQKVKFQQAKATLIFLLENKANINQPNKEGNTLIKELLYEHAGSRHWTCIYILLRHQAELPEGLMDLLDLIRIAAEYNDLPSIKYILDNSKRPYYKNILLAHAATIAINRINLELLQHLQQLGLDLRKPYYFLEYDGMKKQYLLDIVIQQRYTVGSNTADEDARKEAFQIFLQYFVSQNIDVLYPQWFHRTPILHMAATDGFNDIVMTLLQPQYGFSIDLKSADDEHLTPLQIAVIKNNVALAKLLLVAGASPHVLTNNGKTLLHIACENGYVAMVELLLTTKIDTSAKVAFDYFFTSMELTAIHYASQYKDVAIAQQLVSILLPYWSQIDSILLATAIQRHFDEKLLQTMLKKISRNLLTLNKFLNVAIKANNLMACKILLQECPELIQQRDANGTTPLHLATGPGRQEIYHYFLAQGASKTVVDNFGLTIAHYALFFDTYSQLNIPIPEQLYLPEFRKLFIQLHSQEREFSSENDDILFSLGRCCYKLIQLFQTADKAIQFLEQYANRKSERPVHDLCLFELPTAGNWQVEQWAFLVMQAGLEVTQYLHFAPRIESLSDRKIPTTIEELKEIALRIKYNRELENPKLAEFFIKYHIPEPAFNRVLDHYRLKTNEYLPELFIDGKEFGKSRYYFKKLAASDWRGFALGQITNCCQSVGSEGEVCAMHGMISPYSGFYAVFMRADEKELAKARRLLTQAANAITTMDFIDQFNDKSQKQKYIKLFVEFATKILSQNPTIDPVRLDQLYLLELRSYLRAEYEKLLEDELIVQIWACIGETNKNKVLIWDSWERLRADDDWLCMPFLSRAAKQAISKYHFDKIVLGKGGQTPKELKFPTATVAEKPKDYVDYRDSAEQLVVMTKEQYLAENAQQDSQLLPNKEELKSAVIVATTGTGFFQQAPTPTNKNYNVQQFHQLLANYFQSCNNIVVLPPVELVKNPKNTSPAPIAKDNPQLIAAFDKMKEFKSSFRTNNALEATCILPLLLNNGFWTCLLITKIAFEKKESIAITYLDCTAKAMPWELTNLLQSTLQVKNNFNYQYHAVAAIFYEQPENSGIWLAEILGQYAKLGLLLTPVLNNLEKIREDQEKVITPYCPKNSS